MSKGNSPGPVWNVASKIQDMGKLFLWQFHVLYLKTFRRQFLPVVRVEREPQVLESD